MAQWVAVINNNPPWWYYSGSLSYYIEATFTVRKWRIDNDIEAGPFDSLDAAKAALLMIDGAKD